MTCPRPFRVWDSSRLTRKSLVASSLVELKIKGKQKLGFEEETEVETVLETDGTKVQDEEYFSFLPDDSTLLLLKNGESWSPRDSTSRDETDAAISLTDLHDGNTSIDYLTKVLRQDIANIVLFSAQQLQVIVDCDEGELCQLLNRSIDDAKSIQSACQRYLDEKQQATDALQLLSLLKQQSEHSPRKKPKAT